ncbi:MAG: sigma-70 family RNA polymerase sigma factor [Myxococcota bacterium]
MPLLSFRKRRTQTDEFGELIEQHMDGMYRVALRYTRQPAAAEDLVHDTVVRALRFRDRFEMGTNFKAWIYTILTHTFIHRYRRQKREREILDGATRDDVARNLRSDEARRMCEAPERSYFKDLLSDDVVHALDDLPEDFRKVVVLCDIEGLSYKEIADVVGCPVGTVMSRLYRGRRILEEKLVGLAVEQGIVRSTEEAVPEDPAVLDLKSYRRRRTG